MRGFEQEVSGRILQTLLQDLPHRTGRPLTQSSGLHTRFKLFVIPLVRAQSTEFALRSLIDGIDQVVEETGYRLIPYGNPEGYMTSLTATDQAALPLIIQSLNILVDAVILALLLDMVIDPEDGRISSTVLSHWDRRAHTGSHHFNSGFKRLFTEVCPGKVPEISVELANVLLHMVVRICPPKVTAAYFYAPIKTVVSELQNNFFNDALVLQWVVSISQPKFWYQYLSTAETAVFGSRSPVSAVARFAETLAHRSNSTDDLVPYFEGLNGLLKSMKDPKKQRHFFAYLSLVSLQRYTMSYKNQTPWTPEVKRLAQDCIDLLYKSKNINSFVNASEHALITLISLNLNPRSDIWKTFWQVHEQNLTATDVARQEFALVYFTEVARVIPEMYMGHPDWNSYPITAHFQNVYPKLRDTLFTVSTSRPLNRMILRQLVSFNSVFVMLVPKQFYDDYPFSSSSLTWLHFYALFSGILEDIQRDVNNCLSKHDLWRARLTELVLYCCGKASKPSLEADGYGVAFTMGLNLLTQVSSFAHKASDIGKVDLVTILYENLEKLPHMVRNRVLDFSVFILTSPDSTSSHMLQRVFVLLCGFIDAQVGPLLDPQQSGLHFDLDYVHRLLMCRSRVYRDLLNHQGQIPPVTHENQSQLRCAILLALCDNEQETLDRAMECLRLVCEEISHISKSETPNDRVDDYIDHDLMKVILKPGTKRGSSMVHLNSLRSYACGLEAPSRTLALLFQVSVSYTEYMIANYESLASSPWWTSVNKRIMGNIAFLRTIMWQALISSARAADRENVMSYVDRSFTVLYKANDFLREAILSHFRVPRVSEPSVAMQLLVRIYDDHLIPLCLQSYPDPLVRLKTASFVSDMILPSIHLYQHLPAIPVEHFKSDLCENTGTIVKFFEPYMFAEQPSQKLIKPILQLIDAVAQNESVYYYSKSSGLRYISSVLVTLLENQQAVQKMPEEFSSLMFTASASVMHNFKVELPKSGSDNDFDDAYVWFQRILSVFSQYLPTSNELASEKGLADLSKRCIIELFLANPEFVFVLAGESMLQRSGPLRECLVEALRDTCLVDHAQLTDNTQRYDLMAEYLLKTPEVVEIICDSCMPTEIDELVCLLVNFFCWHGEGATLVTLAARKEVQVARTDKDVFRRNSVFVKILTKFIDGLRGSSLCVPLKQLIQAVVVDPAPYLGSMGPEDTGTFPARSVLLKFAETMYMDHHQSHPQLLSLFHCISREIRYKFPERPVNGLRNILLLRVICPRIIFPHQFGYMEKVPTSTPLRALKSVAKLIQKLDLTDPGKYADLEPLAQLFRGTILALCEQDLPSDESLVFYENFLGSIDIDDTNHRLHKYLHVHGREIHASLIATERAYSSAQAEKENNTPSSSSSNDSSSVRTGKLSALTNSFGHLDTKDVPVSETYRRSSLPFSEFSAFLRKLGPPLAFLAAPAETSSVQAPLFEHISNRLAKDSFKGEPYLVSLASHDEIPTIVWCGRQQNCTTMSSKMLIHRLFSVVHSAARDNARGFDLLLDTTFPFQSPGDFLDVVHSFLRVSPLSYMDQCITFFALHMPFIYARELLEKSDGVPFPQCNFERRYMRFDCEDIEPLTKSCLTKDTAAAIEDAREGLQIKNIPLTVDGIHGNFDVVLGRKYIVLCGGLPRADGSLYPTTDIFPHSAVTFATGEIIFQQSRTSYSVSFTFCKDQDTDFYRKVWDKVRPDKRKTAGKMFSPATTAIKFTLPVITGRLLFLCLRDLCSDSESLRYAAYMLLITLSQRFKLKVGPRFDPDMHLHISIVQQTQSIRISAAFAKTHPELTDEVVTSFLGTIALQPESERLVLVRIMTPWLENVNMELKSDPEESEMAIESIVESMLDLIATSKHTRDELIEHAWNTLLTREDIFPTIMRTWVRASVETLLSQDKDHLGQIPIPVIFPSRFTLREVHQVLGFLYDTLDMEVTYSMVTWTDHPSWAAIESIILILSNAILRDSEDISRLLPELSFVILIFCGVGPALFRFAVYRLLLNILDKMMVCPKFPQENAPRVQALMETVQSCRVKTLFGVQGEPNDELYDGICQLDGNDVGEVCRLLSEVNYVALSSETFAPARRSTSFALMKYAAKTFPVLQMRCISALQYTFGETFPSPFVWNLLDIARDVLMDCPNGPIQLAYINSIVYTLGLAIGNVDEQQVFSRQLLWFSMVLLSTRCTPIYTNTLFLFQQCLAVIELRFSTRSNFLELFSLTGEARDLQSWWKSHEAELGVVPTASNVETVFSSMLVSGLHDSETPQATLTACQKLLSLFVHSDYTRFWNDHKYHYLPFMLILYLCTQEFSKVYWNLVEDEIPELEQDEELLQAQVRKFLAERLTYDSDLSITCLVDVCRIVDFDQSMSYVYAGPRLIRLVCEIKDRLLVRAVVPLMRKIIGRLVILEDPELNLELLTCVQTLFSHNPKEFSDSKELMARVKKALRHQGRRHSIDSNFTLVPEAPLELFDPKLSNLLANFCELAKTH